MQKKSSKQDRGHEAKAIERVVMEGAIEERGHAMLAADSSPSRLPVFLLSTMILTLWLRLLPSLLSP